MRHRMLLLVLGIGMLCGPAVAQTRMWTNTAGRAFSARLATLTDTHATFVMPDGVTNVLALTALDPGSQAAARLAANRPRIPESMHGTFDLCAGYLRRLRYQHADGLLDAAAYADARRRILAGFRGMYRTHGLPERDYALLERHLSETAQTLAE